MRSREVARGSGAVNAQNMGRAASRRHERYDGEVSSAFEVADLEFQANPGLASYEHQGRAKGDPRGQAAQGSQRGLRLAA